VCSGFLARGVAFGEQQVDGLMSRWGSRAMALAMCGDRSRSVSNCATFWASCPVLQTRVFTLREPPMGALGGLECPRTSANGANVFRAYVLGLLAAV
jgi:hypothetical protein